MTLSLYIARKFLWAFTRVFLIFTLIILLIGMVEELRSLFGSAMTFGQAMTLAALNTPAGMYQILPLIVILATIMLFLGLARTSELVVIRAAGRSAIRCLVPPLLTTLLIGIFAVAVMNPLVAATSKAYTTLQSHYTSGASNTLSISREGLWLRQGSAEGQMVIHAARANSDGTQLFNVSFITFGAESRPVERIEADSAELGNGIWSLANAKIWHFNDVANPERDATSAAKMTVATDITREQIRDSFGTPGVVSIWQLPGFIDRLQKSGFSARAFQVGLQIELAMPLLLAAMVLIGAGFTMRHVRFGRTGVMVLAALMVGFAIFFLRNFAQVLGVNGQIPVSLAAWTPPVTAILGSLGLLLHLEDG